MKEVYKGREENKEKKEKEDLDLCGEKLEQTNVKRQLGKSGRAQLISYCPFP